MARTPPRSTTTSAIEIPSSHHFRLHNPSSSALYAVLPDRQRSSPMSMSMPQVQDSAPPPLPPPRWVDDLTQGTDPGWEFENRANGGDAPGRPSASIKLGSSLLGGPRPKPSRSYTGLERKVDFEAKGASPHTPANLKSETSDPSTDLRMPDLRDILEYNKLQSENQMGQTTLERSSHAYDKHLLARIGGPRTPSARPGDSAAPGNGGEEATTTAQKTSEKANGQLRPLAMPERRYSDLDVRSTEGQAQVPAQVQAHSQVQPQPQAQWTAHATAPPSSALSPHFSGLHSPLSEHGLDRSHSHPQRPSTMKSEDGQRTPGRLANTDHYDHSFPPPEGDRATRSPGIQQLNINDTSPTGSDDYQQSSKTGQKRRAQSPPNDSVLDPRLPGGINGNNDGWRRRQMQTGPGRNNPNMARFQAPSSLSSTASSAPPNASSYASSSVLSNPSTATSYNSERLSPGAYQRSEAALHANPVPLQQPSQMDHGNPASLPQRRLTSSNIPRPPGLWICDCCPKKPKKFENEDELRIHEMEKQYICQYCHNRFKNKNEAERHQNSLHLRRHSWSCAALTSFEAAFHPTLSNSAMAPIQGPGAPYPSNTAPDSNGSHNPAAYPGALHSTPTDTCGYCGAEFVNPPNWDERVEHLNHVHKFGECNQSKKFFRADHFRQHLKHSHAGTSGKWTNMLENACMKDEPPPQPIAHNTLPPGMPGITMVGQQQLLAAAAAAAAAQGVTHGGMSGYGSPGMGQVTMGSPAMTMAQNMLAPAGQNFNHGMNQAMMQGMGQALGHGPQHAAGQLAMNNATGPMGGGGPPAPIASMMVSGSQQPLHQQQQQQ